MKGAPLNVLCRFTAASHGHMTSLVTPLVTQAGPITQGLNNR